ncbi:MAG TPA: amidase [Rhizomicrobium sp.]|jgi:amidase|nr:amidase [Rhizomicrobium sp.]
MTRGWCGAIAALLISTADASAYDVAEKSIAQLQSDLAASRITSAGIVSAYLARIEATDRNGPALHSVIAINPDAMNEARAADVARKAGRARGPLYGIPLLVKDNVETADPMPTTAGSLALTQNVTRRDAPAVARLRAAGAIILGKTNLSEWANIRSAHSISGWSAIGGLVKNPYVLDRNACGSSSGSGAAVAASLAAAAVGTETDGSLVCPASVNGIVSLKPTVGLISRNHIIPISHSQDTPGPMGRSVADVAALLTAMAGADPADHATRDADSHRIDYLGAIVQASLNGKRLGIAHTDATPATDEDRLFDRAVTAMRKAGAVIVPVKFTPPDAKSSGDAELLELETELKVDLNAYLATTPAAVSTRTLAGLIAFNDSHPRETALFGQDIFLAAEKTKGLGDPAYSKARALLLRVARTDGLDRIFGRYKIDALVMPTDEPAWRVDVVKGDNDSSNSSFLPAVAGYPHLTVPMGTIRELPVGISFIGLAWSEAKLLALGAAFESATHARHAPKYLPSVESTAPVTAAFAPLPSAPLPAASQGAR